jgi:GH25 family lysozyme M1 (1,4-beta-N-acetylmuramidase)
VPGIEKPVDRNVFNGSFGDWRQVLPAHPPTKESARNAN